MRLSYLVEKRDRWNLLNTVQHKLQLKPENLFQLNVFPNRFCMYFSCACMKSCRHRIWIFWKQWLTLWGFSYKKKNSRLDQCCCQDQEFHLHFNLHKNEWTIWFVYCLSAHRLINQVKLNLDEQHNNTFNIWHQSYIVAANVT